MARDRDARAAGRWPPPSRRRPRRERCGSGSTSAGTPKSASSSRSQARRRMSSSWVREALEKSHGWRRPPVRLKSSQLSTVPAHSAPAAARRRPSGTASSSQRDLGRGEQRVEAESGALQDQRLGAAARSRAQTGAVRRHCQTITGPGGLAGRAVPQHHRFALVADGDGGHARRRGAARDSRATASLTVRHSSAGVLLDPAGLRIGDGNRPRGRDGDGAAARRRAAPWCWSCPGRWRGWAARSSPLLPAQQVARCVRDARRRSARSARAGTRRSRSARSSREAQDAHRHRVGG